jgi:hypothetical protein
MSPTLSLLPMSKQTADRLRAIPLEAVLRLCGAQPDRHDRFKWHTAVGTISVTGAKFINWNRGLGGGGAIDLVIHLLHLPFQEALHWLEGEFPNPPPPVLSLPKPALRIPPADPRKLWRVKGYLLHQRGLPGVWIDQLIGSGFLYADAHANAVFLLLGKENAPVGAELRGTTDRRWRGMAPGSQKNLGFFFIPPAGAQPAQPIILCESAIDAISCLALHPDHRCLSTSGARPNPGWLAALVAQGIEIYCGFDTDPTGESAANAMIALYPTIQRLRPTRHDWNAVLTSQS